MVKRPRVLFLVPYSKGAAPAQRFRFEQYLPILEQNSHQYEIHSFLDLETWKILYEQGHYLTKTPGILVGVLKRIGIMIRVVKVDLVFIHRELAPIGPPRIRMDHCKAFP